jgi:SPP1 family predicted phage head-tail adaptor
VTLQVTSIGELSRRLVLEAPVETPDGAGGVTRSYAAVTTLWAQVLPVSARSEFAADSLGARVTHRITIRAPRSINTLNRFRDGDRVFRIVAFREGADRRLVEIEAEEHRD